MPGFMHYDTPQGPDDRAIHQTMLTDEHDQEMFRILNEADKKSSDSNENDDGQT